MRVITGDDAKTIIRLLKDKRPMRIGDFKKALSLREFEIKKLLKELVADGVLIGLIFERPPHSFDQGFS
jgi:predicted ArsR family transcriptional regulator